MKRAMSFAFAVAILLANHAVAFPQTAKESASGVGKRRETAKISTAARRDRNAISEQVIVASPEVKLHTAPQATSPTVPMKPGHLVEHVTDVKGDWFCLEDRWVRKAEVVLADQAIEHFTAEIRRAPTAFAYVCRGCAYGCDLEVEKALADFNSALEIEPNNVEALFHAGTVRYWVGDNSGALRDFDRAIGLNIKHAKAYRNRGNLERKLGKIQEALDDLNEAIRLDPADEDAYQDRGDAWAAQGDIERAIADYRKALSYLGEAFAYVQRGQLCWERQGDYDKAIDDYSRAIALEPTGLEPRLNRARAYEKQGNHQKALDDYGQCVKLNLIGVSQAYRERAAIFELLGKCQSAIDDYGHAIRVFHDDDVSYSRRAWIWATCSDEAVRDGKRAVESATEACKLTSWADPTCIDVLAAALAETGDFAGAVRWQQEAVRLATNKPKVLQAYRERLTLYQQRKPYRENSVKAVIGP